MQSIRKKFCWKTNFTLETRLPLSKGTILLSFCFPFFNWQTQHLRPISNNRLHFRKVDPKGRTRAFQLLKSHTLISPLLCFHSLKGFLERCHKVLKRVVVFKEQNWGQAWKTDMDMVLPHHPRSFAF